MREFNTSGPCDPKQHYTIIREKLIEQGNELVSKGKFFTIFAPRQSGKTTYFHLLMERLKDNYTTIWVSFENQSQSTNEEFYKDFSVQLDEELSQYDFEFDEFNDKSSMESLFKKAKQQLKPIVLFIDEFEGTPKEVLNELMHTFRKMYHRKNTHALHSLVLIGVSTIAELVTSSASPFNVADEFIIPYFTFDEVESLITQYIEETGHLFERNVIETIYKNTLGQPGLVCALCQHLVKVTDKTKPVTNDDFYPTLKYFLTQRYDKNIMNIIQKSYLKKDFMLRLLFSDDPVAFSVYDSDISFMYSNGVIDNINGTVDISVPLYKKCLLTALRPNINGETAYFTSKREDFTSLKTKDGGLNIKGLLQKYTDYVKRRGFKAFDTENLRESAWHYSLDAYINYIVEDLKGHTFIEVPSGRGRTDILIVYGVNKYIVETKVYSSLQKFEDGKIQLAQYLKSEGLSEGFYVVFSNRNEEEVTYIEETIKGLKIHTFIIRIKYERPSNIGVIQRKNEELSGIISLQIETMLARIKALKEDIEDERKILQKKNIDDDEIDVTIKNIQRVEDAIKEIETAQKQNQKPPIGAWDRFMLFSSKLFDENSSIGKVLKGLSDGKNYASSLIESCNKIKASLEGRV